VSWDDILAGIGPVLIDEATEAEVKKKFERCLYAGEMSPEDRTAVRKIQNKSIGVTEGNLETVVVQLRSLGLIESGTKKRVPSDTNKYLRLTPAGVDNLAALKSIAKDVDADADDETSPCRWLTPGSIS
jgi:hypothetical protein